jgi:hypothetical protein
VRERHTTQEVALWLMDKRLMCTSLPLMASNFTS